LETSDGGRTDASQFSTNFCKLQKFAGIGRQNLRLISRFLSTDSPSINFHHYRSNLDEAYKFKIDYSI
jgi:hypothetical protein